VPTRTGGMRRKGGIREKGRHSRRRKRAKGETFGMDPGESDEGQWIGRRQTGSKRYRDGRNAKGKAGGATLCSMSGKTSKTEIRALSEKAVVDSRRGKNGDAAEGEKNEVRRKGEPNLTQNKKTQMLLRPLRARRI